MKRQTVAVATNKYGGRHKHVRRSPQMNETTATGWQMAGMCLFLNSLVSS